MSNAVTVYYPVKFHGATLYAEVDVEPSYNFLTGRTTYAMRVRCEETGEQHEIIGDGIKMWMLSLIKETDPRAYSRIEEAAAMARAEDREPDPDREYDDAA